MLDTGLRTRDGHVAHPWLQDHCVLHSPWRDLKTVGRWDDEDEPDDDGGGRLDVQAGHGTFISGVIRQQCPDARIHHRGVLTSYGDGDDASIVAAIERAHGRLGAPLRHRGDGVRRPTPTTGDPPPVATAVERLLGDSLVVASAGNDATSRPTYPAALPGVVAVGALDRGRPRRVLQLRSVGRRLHAGGRRRQHVLRRRRRPRRARASCASSTAGGPAGAAPASPRPKVAGVIAQELYLHGGTAHDAWARIQARAGFRVPDLGVLVNC